MSYFDISKHIEKIYTFKVSSATLIAVTEKIIPKVKQWQHCPLAQVYFLFGWMLSITKFVNKAVSTKEALEITLEELELKTEKQYLLII